jgi:hypothetical protein
MFEICYRSGAKLSAENSGTFEKGGILAMIIFSRVDRFVFCLI